MRRNWGEYKMPVSKGSPNTRRKTNKVLALDLKLARKHFNKNVPDPPSGKVFLHLNPLS